MTKWKLALAGELAARGVTLEEASVAISRILRTIPGKRKTVTAGHLRKVAEGLRPSQRLGLAIVRWSKNALTLADLGLEVK